MTTELAGWVHYDWGCRDPPGQLRLMLMLSAPLLGSQSRSRGIVVVLAACLSVGRGGGVVDKVQMLDKN